jgi:hypothetical protein
MEYRPAGTAGNCSFQAPVQVANGPPGALPIGAVPLVPAPTQPGRSATALALTSGLYEVAPGTPTTLHQVYASDRPLHNLRAIDLDRDGDLDVVASSNNAEDLDILDRRTIPGPTDTTTFLRFRFDTDGVVTQFLLGDFDGNEIPDVAYVETAQDDIFESNRLKIAYGTPDQLLPGATVGTFFRVLSIIATAIPDSGDPDSIVDDLAVLFEDLSLGPALSLLHGSPQRTMIAFFDPRQQPLAGPSQFRGVVTGRFGLGSFGNDVLAFEELGGSTRVYLSLGATSGQLDPSQLASNADDLIDCKLSTQPGGDNTVCIEDAHFVAWPLSPESPDTRDVVLAIDNQRRISMIDPQDLTPNQPVQMQHWPGSIDAPPGAVVHKVQRIDIAGEPRLLVSLQPGPGANPFEAAAVNLCRLDPATGPSCVNLDTRVSDDFEAAIGSRQVCVDAGQARVAPASRFDPPDTDQPDLLILCRPDMPIDGFVAGGEGLYRISFEPDGEIRRVDNLLFTRADELQIGDVSGDGIDDVILLDRQAQIPRLAVLRQCNSRETECGKVSSQPEPGVRP